MFFWRGFFHLFDEDLEVSGGSTVDPHTIITISLPSTAAVGSPTLSLVPPVTVPTAAGYDIRVYDHTGTEIRILQTWNSLQYTQRINAPWYHALQFDLSAEDATGDFLRNVLKPDHIIKIRRTDPLTGITSLVYEGFNRTIVDQLTATGNNRITLYGSGFTELFTRRIVLPPTGQEHLSYSGIAEDVMRSFIQDTCITPTDTDRIIYNLYQQANNHYGENAEYDARYTNLLTVLTRCAEQGRITFGIIGSTLGNNAFEVRIATIWGEDRRQGNPDGRKPLIFDTNLANMVIPIFSSNFSEEVNVVYVGGQNQGIYRDIEIVKDNAAIATTPWNRREDFLDARQTRSSLGLQTAGNSELEKRKGKETLSFNVRQTAGTRWIRDWGLGDWITARYFDRAWEKVINQVAVSVTAGNKAKMTNEIETIDAEMSDLPLELF